MVQTLNMYHNNECVAWWQTPQPTVKERIAAAKDKRLKKAELVNKILAKPRKK